MKTFKQFIKSVKPALIPVAPVHGSHSKKKEPALIPVAPVHGAHSKTKKLKEDFILEKEEMNHPETVKREHWTSHNDNIHIGRDKHAISDKLHLDDFHKNPHSHHVVNYTTSSTVNRHLLNNAKEGLSDNHLLPEHKEMVHGIDKAFEHEHATLKHDVHLYHGTMGWHPGKLAAEHPEGHIRSAAFLSTTHDKHTATAFSGIGKHSHILHIHAKKGQKALHIGKHSEHSHEHETLLPRNTTLKVHPKPTILHTGAKVWRAHIVDHKDD